MTSRLRDLLTNLLEGRVDRALLFQWAPAYLAVFFLFYGPEFVEFHANQSLHANPFALLEPYQRYLHTSILGPFLAYGLSIHGVAGIMAFYLTLTVLAAAATLVHLRRRWRDPEARSAAFLIVSLSPIWYVLTGYIGNSSCLVVLLYALLLLAPQPLLAWVWAFLLVLAHREIGLAVLGLHILLRKPGRADLTALAAGAVAGLGIQLLYMRHLVGDAAPRVGYALEYWKMWIKLNVLKPVTLLLMAFNWFWIAVIFAASRNLMGWRDLVAILVAIGLSTVTADTTRVATLVALPFIFSVADRIVADDGWRAVGRWPLWALLAFLQLERYAWQTLQLDEMNWAETLPFLWRLIVGG